MEAAAEQRCGEFPDFWTSIHAAAVAAHVSSADGYIDPEVKEGLRHSWSLTREVTEALAADLRDVIFFLPEDHVERCDSRELLELYLAEGRKGMETLAELYTSPTPYPSSPAKLFDTVSGAIAKIIKAYLASSAYAHHAFESPRNSHGLGAVPLFCEGVILRGGKGGVA